MSKKTKTASAERRKKEKRSRKEAEQAKYAAFAKAGQNKKSKRSQNKGKEGRVVRHAVLFCGNIGCIRCFSRQPKPEPKRCLARFTTKPDGSPTLKFTFLDG